MFQQKSVLFILLIILNSFFSMTISISISPYEDRRYPSSYVDSDNDDGTSYEETISNNNNKKKENDAKFWVDAMERIINGYVVDVSDYPYQVALVQTNFKNDKKRIICGGALVGPRTVFTAAHCTHISDFKKRPNLSIFVGGNSLKDPNGKEHSIEKAVRHPKFSFSGLDYDFSVIVLDEPVEYNDRVKNIEISQDRHKGGSTASVSGWGQTEFGEPSKNLRATELELEKWEKCQNYFPKINHPKITRNMLCVKPSETTTYYGDSGGPLTIDGKLVGLVSFGRTVSDNKKTTVFTRVKNFLNFAQGISPDLSDVNNDDE